MNATPDPRFADALITAEPTADYPGRMHQFGQLVGAWDARGARLDEETGIWTERNFTWLVGYILDGRAVQDVEVEPSDTDPSGHAVATAVRVYDQHAGVWRVSYFAPTTGEYCHLVSTTYRHGIRQDGTRTDGKPIRWNFTEITLNSYTWEGWVSHDEGSTWVLIERNTATRAA